MQKEIYLNRSDAPENVKLSCPIRSAVSQIEGKWRILIISYLLSAEETRYGELKRKIPEISEKMLIKELKALQTDGIVGKTSFPEIPPRVHYYLTDKGKALGPSIECLLNWGLKYAQQSQL